MVAVSLKNADLVRSDRGDDTDTHTFLQTQTAYEIHERLVGSEMCIRDRSQGVIPFLKMHNDQSVSYTHLTLPTTPYV